MKFRYRIEKVVSQNEEYFQLVRNYDDAILYANPEVNNVFEQFCGMIAGQIMQP